MTTRRQIYGGDTIRISLANVAHDAISGEVTNNATVNWYLLRADEEEADSGTMTYTTRRDWSASVVVPGITEDEDMLIVVLATVQGAVKRFELPLPVKAGAPLG
jgi:hypothetical protein